MSEIITIDLTLYAVYIRFLNGIKDVHLYIFEPEVEKPQ